MTKEEAEREIVVLALLADETLARAEELKHSAEGQLYPIARLLTLQLRAVRQSLHMSGVPIIQEKHSQAAADLANVLAVVQL